MKMMLILVLLTVAFPASETATSILAPPGDEIAAQQPTIMDLSTMVGRAAERHGVSPVVLQAMANVESNLDPLAVSPKGAVGLLQVMPQYAGKEVYRLRGQPGQPTRQALFQPEYNAEISAEYMGWLRSSFGPDVGLDVLVAAYNAGPGRARRCLDSGRWPQCLPLETRNYLRKVEDFAGDLRWHS